MWDNIIGLIFCLLLFFVCHVLIYLEWFLYVATRSSLFVLRYAVHSPGWRELFVCLREYIGVIKRSLVHTLKLLIERSATQHRMSRGLRVRTEPLQWLPSRSLLLLVDQLEAARITLLSLSRLDVWPRQCLALWRTFWMTNSEQPNERFRNSNPHYSIWKRLINVFTCPI